MPQRYSKSAKKNSIDEKVGNARRLVMVKLIILLGLLTMAAMGQSTLTNQKACSDQAQKVYEKRGGHSWGDFRNHYDPKTDRCWVLFRQQAHADENQFIIVQDAFQNQPEAVFTGPIYKERTALHECSVDDTKCKDIWEFYELVKKHYGL